MVSKKWMALIMVSVLFSACQTNNNPNKNSSKTNGKPKVTRPVPTRAPSNEIPLKSISTKYNYLTAQKCIKDNMLIYLAIPPQFINEIELTDHSNIVILQNPYSNSEGMYFRIVRLDKDKSAMNSDKTTIELYGNGIQFVSNRWYQLLDICK